MNIDKDGKMVLVEDLSHEALETLKQTEYFTKLKRTMEEEELEEDYILVNIRVVPYPKNIPIVFGNLEYGDSIHSHVVAVHNLRKVMHLKQFATGVTIYEKIYHNETAYAIVEYQDYDYNQTCYSLLEIE